MRHYEYWGQLPAKPELGVTVGVDEDDDTVDDYVGVVRSYTLTVAHDGIFTLASVLNHSASVIT